VFENAVSDFHQTSMSMGALFTGRIPSLESEESRRRLIWVGRSWCGMRRFAKQRDDACIPASLTTLAEDFAAAGYWTIGVASNALLYRPAGFDKGFDDWTEVTRESASGGWGKQTAIEDVRGRRSELVLEQVEGALARRPRDRVFLYVHFMEPHDDVRREFPDYASSVVAVDLAVGELLAQLEQQGLLEDALVILTADHGQMREDDETYHTQHGHRGNPSYEPVLEVPLIIAPPPDADATSLVRSHDLRELIVRAAGLGFDGPESILAHDEQLLTEARYWTYRRGRWKSSWPRSGDPPVLFDLEQDEVEDLSNRHPEILVAHRARIDELREQLRLPAELGVRSLSDEDRIRLRLLGYLEEEPSEGHPASE